MHLLTYIFSAFAFFAAFSGVTAAQTSPFGDLNDESMRNRTVLDTSDKDASDYQRVLQEYRDLNTQAQSAFGAQRTALQEQALARAKDVLLSKLGAVETHLQNLIDRLEGTDRAVMTTELADLQLYIAEVRPRIESATSIAELRTISLEINGELRGVFGVGNYYALSIWVSRGLALINLLMGKADLIQAHIDGAGELGGDIVNIQSMFDSAMLALENAKGVYESILSTLSGLGASDPAILAQLQRMRSTNATVVKAHSDLKQVIRELRALYGQSPWMINLREEN